MPEVNSIKIHLCLSNLFVAAEHLASYGNNNLKCMETKFHENWLYYTTEVEKEVLKCQM